MRVFVAFILFTLGAVGLAYVAWSWHRASNDVLSADAAWPRPWPYPDAWLSSLNDWFDARHPAPRGTMKLHGELRRVRLTLLALFVVAGLTCGLGAADVARYWRSCPHGRRGFRVLPEARVW
jgi:hypothetical protein